MKVALQDVDLKHLRIFQTVANAGSFAAAQGELNTSAATVSTAIAQLEQRLRLRLCERGRSGFALTPEGLAVLKAADRLFLSIDAFRSDVALAGNLVSGDVHLGLVDNIITASGLALPPALGAVARSYPALRLRISIGTPAELEAQVMDGRLHLAIGPLPQTFEDLDRQRLFDEHHELYCGADHHLFAGSCEPEPDEVAALPYVARETWETHDGLAPPFAMNEMASSRYIEGLAALVLSGAYVAYLPTHYAAQWVDRGRMRPLLSNQFRRTAEISVIWRRNLRQGSGPRLVLAGLLSQRAFDAMAASGHGTVAELQEI